MRPDDKSASETSLAGPASTPARFRLVDPTHPRSEKGLLPTGVEITCDLREIAHPEGRFRRADGTRYDICVMEVQALPHLRPPAISRSNFIGDCVDNQPAVIRLGNVRQSSFRLCLISPGEALGTLAAAAKTSTQTSL